MQDPDKIYNEMINHFSGHHSNGDREMIKRAYQFARAKHEGTFRRGGEPFICHPARVARSLAEQGFDSDYLAAALLHDVVEDCGVSIHEIRELFGRTVARIVDAVTSLSDKDFNGQKVTKKQIDILSDARLQNKMNIQALYIKIADRIDNLSTISVDDEGKRLRKAEHTREILIPMAELANAYFYVDQLEELCFQIEHAQELARMRKIFEEIDYLNQRSLRKSLHFFEKIFDPAYEHCVKELDHYRRYIHRFWHQDRTMISLYRQVTATAENLFDLDRILRKESFAFQDLFLIVSNDLEEEGTPIRPHDLFFKYFELALSGNGFYFVDYCRTTHRDATYFTLADEMDNLYRLFIRTSDEYERYKYGNVIDDRKFFPGVVNEMEPRDTYTPKIKVFCADGEARTIDKGATVLDLAFQIHTDLGLHFKYAQLNGNRTHLPAHTKLNQGDTVVITEDENTSPVFAWFKYVHTSNATDKLVRYFERLYTPGADS